MKRSDTSTRRGLVILLIIAVALSSIENVESSKLKRTRRMIEHEHEHENGDESETETETRRRLTMADDVFGGTDREFQVIGYHRAVGGAVSKIIKGFLNGIRGTIHGLLNLVIRMLQTVQKTIAVAVEEPPEPEPEPPTMASIYDSISSVMSDSNDPEPNVHNKQKQKQKQTSDTKKARPPVTTIHTTAPLLNKNNIPKVSSTSRDALRKKSVMDDLVKGGSPPDFDSAKSAVVLSDESDVTVQASYLAGLLPTLVAGLVFSTAGTLVGYLWNTEWRETAYTYYDYYWGEGEGDAKIDAGRYYDVVPGSSSTGTGTTTTFSGHDDMSAIGETYDDIPSSNAIPITPNKF